MKRMCDELKVLTITENDFDGKLLRNDSCEKPTWSDVSLLIVDGVTFVSSPYDLHGVV